jgi:MoaA/NifB/PqqE/SkfB family radical SAM enzyme
MVKIKRTRDGILYFDRHTGLHILKENHELNKVEKQIPINNFPDQFNIALTNRCNMECKHCYANSSPFGFKDLYTKEDILKLVKKLDKLGCLEVAFGGGEPLLFKDFDELIIEAYKSTHMAFNFTTNGTLLTKKFLDKIKGYVGCIRVSVDGIGKEYKIVRGINGWNSVEKGINALRRSGVNFGFNVLFSSVNFQEYVNILEYAYKIGCSSVLFTPFRPYGRGKNVMSLAPLKKDFQNLAKFLKRVKPEYRNIEILVDASLIDFMKENGLPILPTRTLDGCGAGSVFASLTEDGYLKNCSFQPSVMFVGKDFDKLDSWKSNEKGCQCWNEYINTFKR